MGDVINLNRFRKKKAREEKERRADTNRRLHGRTKAERARDEADKKRLEKKIDGAFLVREVVGFEDVPSGEDHGDFEKLEAATRDMMSLQEFSSLLTGAAVEKNADTQEPESERVDSASDPAESP